MAGRVLYEGSPDGLTVGDARDMLSGARWDGWLDVTVNVTLADGATVMRVPTAARIEFRYVECLGLEGLSIALDVDARVDADPEVQFALGMIDEDEYWDRTSYD